MRYYTGFLAGILAGILAISVPSDNAVKEVSCEIQTRRYDSIESKLKENRLPIDNKYSISLCGSQLVIHVPGKHSDVYENKRKISKILDNVGVDSIGLENFAGNIYGINNVKRRFDDFVELYKTKSSEIKNELIKYKQQVPEKYHTLISKLAKATFNAYLSEIPSQATDTHAIDLYGKKLIFGLEYSQEKNEIARDFGILNQLSYGGPVIKELMGDISPGTDAYEGIKSWSGIINKKYLENLAKVKAHGLEVSKESYEKFVVEERSEDWAETISNQEGVLLTIGGKSHTTSYFNALKARGISVITLEE
jgi:hypothetical protein